jgi:hypothetical protein
MTYKPTKKGHMTKGGPPPRDEDHQRLLDRAANFRDRQQIQRMREVFAAARKRLIRA